MSRDATAESARVGWLRLGARLAAGALLLALAVHYADPRAVLGKLGGADRPLLALALAVSIAANFASALRWAAIARALELKAPNLRLVWMYARGIMLNVLLPGATLSGDVLRSVQLSRLGNPLMRSGLSVFFDRFSGLWVLCAMSLAATLCALLLASSAAAVRVPPGAPLYALGLVGILIAPLLPWPVQTLHRAHLGLLRKLAACLEALRSRLRSARPALLRSLWMSVVVQALSALTLWLCALAVGIPLSYWVVLAAAAPIFVMAALPIGFAGFGTRELAAVAVFGALGIPADQATATALLFGVCVIAQGVLAAPLFLLRS
jgi:uncharacterized membrane protein YbhN (UPF0104 family)